MVTKGIHSNIKDKKNMPHQDLTTRELDKLLAENHYIYKIKLSRKLAGEIAQELGMKVYN
jgi:hypothetical protein